MSELSCFFFELKKKRFSLSLSVALSLALSLSRTLAGLVSLASLGVDLLFSVDNGEKERNKEGGEGESGGEKREGKKGGAKMQKKERKFFTFQSLTWLFSLARRERPGSSGAGGT